MKIFPLALCLYLLTQSSGEAKYVPVGIELLWNTLTGEFLSKLNPLQLNGPYELNLEETQLSVHGSVDRLVIDGLSEFSVHDWHVDEAASKIEFNLDLAELTSTGHYDIDGLLINFFPLKHSGNFKMEIQNIRVTGTVDINGSSKNGILMDTLALRSRFGSLAINLEKTGSDSEETINQILSVVLADLYYQHEEKIMKEMANLIQSAINQIMFQTDALKSLVVGNILSHKSEEFDVIPRLDISSRVDSIFSSIRINASNGGWDPIRIRSESDEFSVSLFGATINGAISLSNIRIGGFSTIHRTGVCTSEIRPSRTSVVVFVGGNDIEIGLDVGISIGPIKLTIQVELIVRHVDLKVNVAVNTNDLSITLDEFLLNEIGTIKITIGGIPGGGSKVISNRLSLLSNLVKDSLRYAFQEALRPFAAKAIEGPLMRDFLVGQL